MRTLKLTIAYDGTRYAGWQVQTRSSQRPTIQGTIERVLSRILRESVKVVGSGRTDAGVHALSQVAHVKTRSVATCERLLRSLNQLLPPDIAVTRVEEVKDTFHARFSASQKRYRYRVFTGSVVPPFIRPYVHQARAPLNLALMRREAAALKGRHDFRAFARARWEKDATIRTITGVQLRRRGDEIHLEIEGNGFLHTMVRSVAGTLLDIGRGRLPPGTMRRMLVTGERRLAGTTAPPRGLALVFVAYEEGGG
jgi:tRNA pseudouridine38-40 synthase